MLDPSIKPSFILRSKVSKTIKTAKKSQIKQNNKITQVRNRKQSWIWVQKKRGLENDPIHAASNIYNNDNLML